MEWLGLLPVVLLTLFLLVGVASLALEDNRVPPARFGLIVLLFLLVLADAWCIAAIKHWR